MHSKNSSIEKSYLTKNWEVISAGRNLKIRIEIAVHKG